MRDPFSWSLPLFRAFGIQVRIHIIYIILTLGLILRAYSQDPHHWLDFVLIWVVMLFVIILLHEFGHCFAARRVNGDAEEILMWPLGGLAYCSVPHTARANLVTAVGGPMVNVWICLAATVALFIAGFLPPMNIFQSRQLYQPELHHWKTGTTALPGFGNLAYFADANSRKLIHSYQVLQLDDGSLVAMKDSKAIRVIEPEEVRYPTWVLWTARLFWVSWMLLLFNLLPAFPLDGGRILQCLIWGRTDDFKQATTIACYAGFATAFLFLLISFWLNETMLLALGIFILITCYQQLRMLEMGGYQEAGAFGYDFSKGYGAFGADEDRPRKKREGFIRRWVKAKRERRLRKEKEQQAADEIRLDELLEKISREGKDSLTSEERRFMQRMSDRKRDRTRDNS